MARPDVSPETRSRIMAAVKGTGSKSTEWRLRAALMRAGLRGWRMNVSDVLGKPDFLFAEQRVLVFVDGCFWHGCPQHYRRPSTSQTYWDAKVARNMARDRKNRAQLKRDGWRVLRVWEHEVKLSPAACALKVKSLLDLTGGSQG
ncbi:MAG TPA: very short patch repair endonuclease [Pyrinomonadaceae bacterium]